MLEHSAQGLLLSGGTRGHWLCRSCVPLLSVIVVVVLLVVRIAAAASASAAPPLAVDVAVAFVSVVVATATAAASGCCLFCSCFCSYCVHAACIRSFHCRACPVAVIPILHC